MPWLSVLGRAVRFDTSVRSAPELVDEHLSAPVRLAYALAFDPDTGEVSFDVTDDDDGSPVNGPA